MESAINTSPCRWHCIGDVDTRDSMYVCMYYASALVETSASFTREKSTVIFLVSYLHVSLGDLQDFADAAFRGIRYVER